MTERNAMDMNLGACLGLAYTLTPFTDLRRR
jgi:hypothetical protein